MSYRKKYEGLTDSSVPSGFDIHHLGGDRKNNDVYDLVAIPTGLHRKFHAYERSIMIWNFDTEIDNQGIIPLQIGDLEKLIDFHKIKCAIYYFCSYRDYLIGSSRDRWFMDGAMFFDHILSHKEFEEDIDKVKDYFHLSDVINNITEYRELL